MLYFFLTCEEISKVFFLLNLQYYKSLMVQNSHLKSWHLVGLNIKAWISSLIERPVVWFLLNNKSSIYGPFNKHVYPTEFDTTTMKTSSISHQV